MPEYIRSIFTDEIMAWGRPHIPPGFEAVSDIRAEIPVLNAAPPPAPTIQVEERSFNSNSVADGIVGQITDEQPGAARPIGIGRPRFLDAMPRFRVKSSQRKNYLHFTEEIGSIFKKSGYQGCKKDTFLGLELENEALKPVSLPKVSGWTVHSEGSLRGNGFEYVQQYPQPYLETLRLLSELLHVVVGKVGKDGLTNSIRTSTHVHFDVTRYSFLDIVNFSSLYWILEGFLSHYCGESRKGNLFCLRLKDATVGQLALQEAIKSADPWDLNLVRNDYRYASVNFASIAKFGSLEFRMMRGSSDYETLEKWINALEAVKQYALQFKTPIELHNHFVHDISAQDLPEAVLGQDLFRTFEACRDRNFTLQDEIRDGFLSVSGTLASHKSYDFTKEVEEEKERRKKEEKEEKELSERLYEESLRLVSRTSNVLYAVPMSTGSDDLRDSTDNTGDVFIEDMYTDE